MSLDAEHTQQLISRLESLIGQTGVDPAVENVHHLRTHARRLEALLKAQSGGVGKATARLMKRLRKVRRRAGQVRDLDVQIAALEALAAGRADRHRLELLQALRDERSRQQEKLTARLDSKTTRKLRRGVRRAGRKILKQAASQPEADTKASAERAVERIREKFRGMNRPLEQLSDPELHAWRIECKRMRYQLEAMGNHGPAARLARQFKEIQDAVGEWHDWLTLVENAHRLTPRAGRSPLTRLLQSRLRRQHDRALQVLAMAKRRIGAEPKPAGRTSGIRLAA